MAIIPGEFEKNIVIDTPQRQKNKKMIAIFAVIVIFIIGVIYFGFFSGSDGTSVDPAMLSGVTGTSEQINPVLMGKINERNKLFESLNKINLDNPIFKDKKFQSLILSDRLPVVVGEKGRENPFLPF